MTNHKLGKLHLIFDLNSAREFYLVALLRRIGCFQILLAQQV